MAEIHIVFDGPPGPEAGRFVEVENASGRSIRFGEWRERPDGYWALVFQHEPAVPETKHDVARALCDANVCCVGRDRQHNRPLRDDEQPCPYAQEMALKLGIAGLTLAPVKRIEACDAKARGES